MVGNADDVTQVSEDKARKLRPDAFWSPSERLAGI
jgi:hypothetical protein